MDTKKAKEAIHMLLEALGEDPSREGLVDTPRRVAKMYEEVLSGNNSKAKDHLSVCFEAPNGDYILQKDIEFHSLCEHHLLPFFGKIAVAYIPNGKVVGLSKISRVVETYCRRLQLQEKLGDEIATAFEENLDCLGVMVVIEAEHTCMTMRGVKKIGSRTVTISSKGKFSIDYSLRREVLDLL